MNLGRNFLIIIFFFSIKCYAFQSKIIIEKDLVELNLKNYAGVFTSDFKIELDSINKSSFKKIKDGKDFFYFNFNKSTIWIYLKLESKRTSQKELFFRFSNAMINEFIVYKKAESDLEEVYKNGIIHTFESREPKNKNFLAPILLIPNKTSEYYIKINKKEGRPLVTNFSLIDGKLLNETQQKEYTIIGAYVGLTLIFITIGLCLFVFFKDTMYMHYSMYLLFLCLFILAYTGVFQQYFLSTESLLNKYYHYVIFSEISLVFFVTFSQKFLEIKKHQPKLYGIINTILVFIVVLRVLLHFFFDKVFSDYIPFFMKIWYGILLFGVILITYQIITSIRKKFIKNKVFAFAYIVMILGTVIMVLYHSYGVVDGVYFNLPLLLYTSLVEIILISIALGISIKNVLKEKQNLILEIKQQKEKNLIDSILLNNKTKVYLENLMYVKSDGNYIEFYLKNDKFLDRNKMKVLEEKLPANFVRIHKSYIINKNYIKTTSSKSVVLADNVEVPLSRHYKKNL